MNTTKLVITGDIHINGGRWGGNNPDTGRSRAAEHTYEIWLSICQRAVSERAALLVCGDLFLDGHPRPEDVEMIADGIRMLSQANLETVVLRGNHDPRHLPTGQRNPLGRYADLPGVTVIDTPMVHTLTSGVSIVGLPWPRTIDYFSRVETVGASVDDADASVAERAVARLVELIEESSRTDGPVVVMAHCTVDVARLGTEKRGSEVTLGKLLHEPVLPLSAFIDPRISHAALGHIHRRQQLADRVWYCGSPDAIDFSEAGQQKAYSVVTIDLTTNKAVVESVPTDARAFRTIEVGSDTELDKIYAKSGELVRIRLDARSTLSEHMLRKQISQYGAEVVTVSIIPPPEREERRRSLKEEVGVVEGLKRWLEITGEDPSTHAQIIEQAEMLIAEVTATGKKV